MATEKKFKLKVKSEKVKELLDLFNKEEIEFYLNLPDSKETYKNLVKLDVDWDFEQEQQENGVQEEPVVVDNKQPLNIRLINQCKIENYNDMSTLIEACRRIATRKPNLVFGNDDWIAELESTMLEIGNEAASFDHMSMRLLCESYYYSKVFLEFEEALADVLNKLKNNWKQLPEHKLSSSLMKVLFG